MDGNKIANGEYIYVGLPEGDIVRCTISSMNSNINSRTATQFYAIADINTPGTTPMKWQITVENKDFTVVSTGGAMILVDTSESNVENMLISNLSAEIKSGNELIEITRKENCDKLNAIERLKNGFNRYPESP